MFNFYCLARIWSPTLISEILTFIVLSYLVLDFILELVLFLFAFSWFDKFLVLFKSGKWFQMSLLEGNMAGAICVVAFFCWKIIRKDWVKIWLPIFTFFMNCLYQFQQLNNTLLLYFLAYKLLILHDGFI